MAETETVTLGELMTKLQHAHQRMSTRKGDKLVIRQTMQVLTMMATRIAELQAELSASHQRERAAQVRSKELVLTDG